MAALVLGACGGKEFAAGPSAGSGGVGGEGVSGGGRAADAGGPATAGGGSDAGASSAGTGPVSCDCRTGSYCRDLSTDCLSCSDFDRFRFHPPERLDTVSHDTGTRFPRAGQTGTDLLYEHVGVGIRHTTDSSTSAGSLVADSIPGDAAPLLMPSGVTSSPAQAPFNFAFDRAVEGERREIFFGRWNDGLEEVARAPEPFNDRTSSNFRLAVAWASAEVRGYWLSDRYPPGVTLLTAEFADDSTVDSVVVTIADSAYPYVPSSSLSPWISAGGETLLFSHDVLPAEPPEEQAPDNDLYHALVPTALPSAITGATPLDDVNSSYDDVEPSLSADSCELYFSSNRDGTYAVYRARRR